MTNKSWFSQIEVKTVTFNFSNQEEVLRSKKSDKNLLRGKSETNVNRDKDIIGSELQQIKDSSKISSRWKEKNLSSVLHKNSQGGGGGMLDKITE